MKCKKKVVFQRGAFTPGFIQGESQQEGAWTDAVGIHGGTGGCCTHFHLESLNLAGFPLRKTLGNEHLLAWCLFLTVHRELEHPRSAPCPAGSLNTEGCNLSNLLLLPSHFGGRNSVFPTGKSSIGLVSC